MEASRAGGRASGEWETHDFGGRRRTILLAAVGGWRPLLEGAAREAALSAVKEIAEALRDPPPAPAPTGTTAPEHPLARLGLCSGRAGIALFMGYVARAGLMEGADDLASGFLAEAETGCAGHPLEPSLASGVTGIAWVHTHLNHRLFRQQDGGSLDQVDHALIDLLNRWPWPGLFGLLDGLVGIGIYAMERLPRRSGRTLARLVVMRLAELAVEAQGHAAWFTPASAGSGYPDGYFDLGLAHGTPGVVAFLARAAQAGISPKVTVPLLRRATGWLLSRQLPSGLTPRYPAYCEADGRMGAGARTAWCYGDPGIAAALVAAGIGADQPAWRATALGVAESAAQRPFGDTRVRDSGLCHGSAGVAHVFNRLAHATGSARLRQAAREWFNRTLDARVPDWGIAGFTSLVGDAEAPMEVSDPGLLTGVAGIGLALLAAATPIEPRWDRLLLLDTPGFVPVPDLTAGR